MMPINLKQGLVLISHRMLLCTHIQHSPPSCVLAQGGTLKMRPQIMLLCGADVLESMAKPGVWENLEALFTEYGVVAVARPGSDEASLLKNPHLEPYLPFLKIVRDFEHSDISSSKVRATWRAGGSVASSLSEGVEKFMRQEHLYPKQA